MVAPTDVSTGNYNFFYLARPLRLEQIKCEVAELQHLILIFQS